MESSGDVDRVGEAEDPGQGFKNVEPSVEPKIADLLSDLLREMKENNRLLRALGIGKADVDGLVAGPAVMPLQHPHENDLAKAEEQSEPGAALKPASDSELAE